MNILRRLTWRHLKQNRKRTVITVIGIVLSVAMVTAVSGMVVSFQDLLYRDSIETEGLWHVRYAGVPDDVAQQVARESVFSAWERIETDDGPVLSLLFETLDRRIFDRSEAVCLQYGIEPDQVRYHNNLLIAKGIVPGPYYRALYSFAGILLGLIAIGSVLVISNSFTISSDQRGVQFGLLKSVGATGRQIRSMVLFEGLLLLVIAIPVGILAGLLAQWVALSIANRVLGSLDTVNLSAWFRVIVSPAAFGVSAVMALLTVLLAAWFPARKAARLSAVESVRQTRSIRLTRRQVRVSPLTRKLFGFEGMLAAKSLKRNRGKYRTTILALVVSIVLFIGVSSFGGILTRATTLFYEDVGSTVAISMSDGTAAEHDRLAAEITGWNEGVVHPSRVVSGYPELPAYALSETYMEYFPDQIPVLRLIGIGAADYEALCRELRISPEHAANLDDIPAVLINTTGTFIQQSRRTTFTPWRLKTGDAFDATVDGRDIGLRIAAVTEEILPGVITRFSPNSLNLIVPDAVVVELWPEDQGDFLWLAVDAPHAAVFAQRARELLDHELAYHAWSVLDYERAANNNRNISALVMLFVYGFIAMLTLIGVTSVIATISTGVALRAREFAMLRSVGMTERAIRRMLRYESLLYGVRALLWGVPAGVLVSALLYRAMITVMEFPYVLPVQSILISIVAILLLTVTTMAFAWNKQRQLNISRVLRDDVV